MNDKKDLSSCPSVCSWLELNLDFLTTSAEQTLIHVYQAIIDNGKTLQKKIHHQMLFITLVVECTARTLS